MSEARNSVVGTILDAREAECEVHNTESAIYRSKISRSATQSNDDSKIVELFGKKNYGDLNFCSDCKTDQKAKDKFWGLASESADEEEYERNVLSMRKLSHDVTELNEDEANELFKKLNIKDKQEETEDACRKENKVVFQVPSTVNVHDSDSSRAYVIKRRPSGRAGRGTWATPSYSPNWLVFETQGSHQRSRTTSVAESNKGMYPHINRVNL